MKQLEKWLKENGYGSLKDNHDNSCDNGFTMGLESGWRGALEWVSTFTISESIKRELKDE